MNMITTLLIWFGWFLVGSTVWFVLPMLPLPKVFNPGSNKVLKLQVTLFVMGWIGKLFAGGLYFAVGKEHAIAMALCALAMLYSVFVLGCIFKKQPSKAEQIEELKRQLEALGVQSTQDISPADQNMNSHTSASESETRTPLSFSDLENRIRARRGV